MQIAADRDSARSEIRLSEWLGLGCGGKEYSLKTLENS